MATIKMVQGARTALTSTGLSTLASANFSASDAVNNTTNNPIDLLLEVEVAVTSAPSSFKIVTVYAKASLNGADYQSGPESGSVTTDETDLTWIGTLTVNTASTTHRKVFSIASAFGVLPAYVKFVFKNETGVALTSGATYISEVTGTST